MVSELRIDGMPQLSRHPIGALQIGPSQRSFSVEFAALDYADPQRSRYAHQLDGFDTEWIESGSDFRIASYSNLEPGNYLLRVRATNRSGDLEQPGAGDRRPGGAGVVAAYGHADAWQRPCWCCCCSGIERWRTGHLRRGKLALEGKVQQRTAELERVAAALQLESAALEEASMTDSLSGLRNRRFLMRYIEAESRLVVRRHTDHEKREGSPSDDSDLIFFLIDIDHFKQINDQHGHAAGDAVIAQMRERLQQVFRDSDYLVRWGGEEFLIVARGTSRVHAASLAERVLHAVSDEPFALNDGNLLHKTCSVGFSCFPLSPTHPRCARLVGLCQHRRCGALCRQANRAQRLAGTGERARRLGRRTRRPGRNARSMTGRPAGSSRCRFRRGMPAGWRARRADARLYDR